MIGATTEFIMVLEDNGSNEKDKTYHYLYASSAKWPRPLEGHIVEMLREREKLKERRKIEVFKRQN